MIVRKGFYFAHLVAAIVLPVWLLVGWSIFGGGGLEFFLVFFGAGMLALVMLAVSGIVFARRSVRVDRALSWPDVGILAAWYACIVASGFFPPWGGILVTLVILGAAAAFWGAIVQLVAETRRRVKSVFESFSVPMAPPGPGFASVPPSSSSGSYYPPSSNPPQRSPYSGGEYIVIETSRERERRPD